MCKSGSSYASEQVVKHDPLCAHHPEVEAGCLFFQQAPSNPASEEMKTLPEAAIFVSHIRSCPSATNNILIGLIPTSTQLDAILALGNWGKLAQNAENRLQCCRGDAGEGASNAKIPEQDHEACQPVAV